ncbi:hypothetical protein B0F90DRAFT_1629338 [Multifurca ochricompacta]|uniref:Transmembrane protein n=1 Tax=Multifurca ochricompacta TaxID=376703 RepID=A0AAD4M5S6_9AGAM|nr:hypothetical protein B0F90DRAFT_1629338 [Multifurca ochricompacta]
MKSPPPVDDTRSPKLNSPGFIDLDTTRPAHLSFRSSVGLIPTPGTVSKRHPTYEPIVLRFWVVTLGCALLGAIGIGLEVARKISDNNDGFHVPEKNVFSFASTQFLTSFFPSLIFVPLAYMVHGFDWAIRMWNPYLILSRGQASADETLLVDYPTNYHIQRTEVQTSVCYRVYIHDHGCTAIPTPSGVHLFRSTAAEHPASTAQSIKDIGLSPDIGDLTAFAASAGFACLLMNSIVFNGLGDPSFVLNGWAIAEFKFPTDSYLNGTMAINTTGIRTDTNCAIPNQVSVNSPSANVTTVSATSVDGCSLELSFNPNDADQQYGVSAVPNCGVNSTDVAFQPVFFWFWQQNPRRSAGVFCQPHIQLFDVTARAFLNNGSLTNVSIIDNYPNANNVSGPPLNDIPYNGHVQLTFLHTPLRSETRLCRVVFGNSSNINIQSRANAIRSGIPNSIFRQAEQSPGGLDSVFQDQKAFVSYTTQIYTRHLSLATKSNYFVPTNNTVDAVLTQLVPRLYVEPLAAHLLAVLCMLAAAIVFGLHFWHFRERRDIYLAHPPGSIGSAVALTSHSGFGDLLMPYDNVATFSRALAPFRFSLDRRTGAIVVDDTAVAYGGEIPTQVARDETMMTLIGKGQRHRQEDSYEGETPRAT